MQMHQEGTCLSNRLPYPPPERRGYCVSYRQKAMKIPERQYAPRISRYQQEVDLLWTTEVTKAFTYLYSFELCRVTTRRARSEYFTWLKNDRKMIEKNKWLSQKRGDCKISLYEISTRGIDFVEIGEMKSTCVRMTVSVAFLKRHRKP